MRQIIIVRFESSFKAHRHIDREYSKDPIFGIFFIIRKDLVIWEGKLANNVCSYDPIIQLDDYEVRKKKEKKYTWIFILQWDWNLTIECSNLTIINVLQLNSTASF